MELTTPLGLVIAVVALFLVFKVAKTVIKIVLLLVVAAGVYLALNGDSLNLFG